MGHEMTAFVRNSEKLYDQLGEHSAKLVKVIVDDMMNPVRVREALVNQDAAIIAPAMQAREKSLFVSSIT